MSSININIGVNMSPGDRFNFGYSGGISAATITVPAGYFYLYGTTTPVTAVNRTSDATPDLTCHTAFVGNVNYQFTYNDTSSVSIDKNNTTNNKIISTLLNLWYGLPANKVTYLRHFDQIGITGPLSDAPSGLTYWSHYNCTGITGPLSDAPSGLTTWYHYNCTGITGPVRFFRTNTKIYADNTGWNKTDLENLLRLWNANGFGTDGVIDKTMRMTRQ